jgi:hypothetical protein
MLSQLLRKAPTLYLSLVSKICLSFKICLGLKTTEENFCAAGLQGIREYLIQF